jgi:uncharacterized protein (TIGR03118 family)
MVIKQTFTGAALALALVGAVAAPTGAAGATRATGATGAHRAGTFRQINLVSDQPGVARLTDPDLVNAWGMSHGPGTPLWVSDNGADVTTLYQGAVSGSPVMKVPLTVRIPGGAPTGQVFNDTQAFGVPGTSAPALFVFAGEHGTLSAWNRSASPLDAAVAVHHTAGAVYKGLALVHTGSGPRLLAANFHSGRIDVFDGSFHRVHARRAFRDARLPRHYAPFNVAVVGGRVFVTYARQDAQRMDDVAGPGHGFVDVFTPAGRMVRRFATRGVLDSPWGMTIAPAGFGRFAGDLLVGNFGNGRIHAFDPRSGAMRGTLRGTNHRPLRIDGLWGLITGDPVAGGTDSVWFSAGPDDEQHGLLGMLRAR